MHYGRILAVVGVIVAAVGFALTSASSTAGDVLEQLNQATGGQIPAGFDNTWTALYNDTAWAAVVFAIAALGGLIVAVMPPLSQPMKRIYGLTAAVLGVLMLVIAVFATMGAMDDADTLQAALADAFAGGLVPEAYTVSIGWGWWLLILSGVLVAIGGVVSLIARPNESAIS